MNEEWKGLIYQGIDLSYKMEISNTGKLRNINTKKLYSQTLSKKGYLTHFTSLGKRGDVKLIRIHIAVCSMFLENTENKPQVNHKDGIKTNNNINNLEWSTAKENMIHAFATGLSFGRKGLDSKLFGLNILDIEFIINNYKPRDKIYGTRALGRKFSIDHKAIVRIIKERDYWIDIINKK